jgi:uncharacterized membrane protein
MRPGEVDGVDYHFISEEEFLKRKNQNFFIETTLYNHHYYGTAFRDASFDKVLTLILRCTALYDRIKYSHLFLSGSTEKSEGQR